MIQLTVAAALGAKTDQEMITVAASASVAEAVDAMAAREVGAVVAMTEDKLVAGIFTERDLLLRVVKAGRDPATTPVSMVMTRDVRFVTPGTTLDAALALMYVQHIRHLMVIDGPHVHGLISIRDLALQLIRLGEGRFEAAVREAAAVKTP